MATPSPIRNSLLDPSYCRRMIYHGIEDQKIHRMAKNSGKRKSDRKHKQPTLTFNPFAGLLDLKSYNAPGGWCGDWDSWSKV